MKSFYFASLATFAALVTAVPVGDGEVENRATPKVYLAGDSTMALGGGGSGTQVVNNAKGGRSARSFTDEGRFTAIANVVTSSDYVIIEFGHNDGGSLTPTDNGRSDCVGAGSETCTTAAGVVVQTYPTYITNAAKLMTAKGAHVIISSPTPNNICETGTCSYTPPRFTAYGKASATAANGTGLAGFVDHGQYLANEYIKEGAKTVGTYYPNDHTHTSPLGASIVAQQFVKGLLCAGNPLAAFVVNSTDSISGKCI